MLFRSLIALLLLAATAAAQSPAAAQQALYQKARAAEARQQYAEAAGYYESMLKAEPAQHALRANLGLMRYLNGEYEQAAQAFQKALAGDATLTVAHLFLGLILLDGGRPAEALPHLERAVRDKPQDLNARFQLARGYYQAERWADAARQLQTLREKQPDDAETLHLLGRVHLKLSLAAYDELKQKHPDNYRIFQLLGENYEAQGLNGPALANYRKAIERNPRARGIWVRIGALEQGAGQAEKAIEAFEQELRLNARDAYALFRLGELRLEQNQSETAAKLLEQAIAADPRLAPARVSYGKLLVDQKQTAAALAQLREAAKLDPENAAAWFQLARAHQQAGDAASANSALQKYNMLKEKIEGSKQ